MGKERQVTYLENLKTQEKKLGEKGEKMNKEIEELVRKMHSRKPEGKKLSAAVCIDAIKKKYAEKFAGVNWEVAQREAQALLDQFDNPPKQKEKEKKKQESSSSDDDDDDDDDDSSEEEGEECSESGEEDDEEDEDEEEDDEGGRTR